MMEAFLAVVIVLLGISVIMNGVKMLSYALKFGIVLLILYLVIRL
jgi:hypothetical protein